MVIQLPPKPDIASAAGRLWTLIDERINTAIRQLGIPGSSVPRPRTITVTAQLAANTPLVVTPVTDPVTGLVSSTYITSIPVYTSCRIIGWELHALTAGIVVVDLKLSSIQVDPLTVPLLTPINGSDNFLAMNGYTTGSTDTSAWLKREFSAGSVINVYVVSADAVVAQCVLGLQLEDLDSRVLQV